jgi:hypothetical protein
LLTDFGNSGMKGKSITPDVISNQRLDPPPLPPSLLSRRRRLAKVLGRATTCSCTIQNLHTIYLTIQELQAVVELSDLRALFVLQ